MKYIYRILGGLLTNQNRGHKGIIIESNFFVSLILFFFFFIQIDMQVSILQKMCEIFPQQKIIRGKIKSHVSSPNK